MATITNLTGYVQRIKKTTTGNFVVTLYCSGYDKETKKSKRGFYIDCIAVKDKCKIDTRLNEKMSADVTGSLYFDSYINKDKDEIPTIKVFADTIKVHERKQEQTNNSPWD